MAPYGDTKGDIRFYPSAKRIPAEGVESEGTPNPPGEFVTVYGYEWAQQGHTNAYFLTPEDTVLVYGPRMDRITLKGVDAQSLDKTKSQITLTRPPDRPAFRVPCAREGELMQILKKLPQPVFCIAHVHTRYSEGVDDAVLWLDEIYSMHLHERKKREDRLRSNLQRGLRLGVVAGSDMHRLAMGHLCRQPGELWPQGGWETCQYQTAVLQDTFAPELTRPGLYEGMKDEVRGQRAARQFREQQPPRARRATSFAGAVRTWQTVSPGSFPPALPPEFAEEDETFCGK